MFSGLLIAMYRKLETNPRFIRETREGRETASEFDASALANQTNAYRILTNIWLHYFEIRNLVEDDNLSPWK